MLFRALEPLTGIDRMIERRSLADPRRLASGPGRLCQSLAVEARHDGQDVTAPPFALELAAAPAQVVAGPRIGITKATDQPWRYGLAGSPFLSRPFKAGPASSKDETATTAWL